MKNYKEPQEHDDKMKGLIAGVLLFAFLFINVAVFTIPDVSENKLAFHLLGVVDFCMGALVNYYWGSSKGSKDKDRKIEPPEDDPDSL